MHWLTAVAGVVLQMLTDPAVAFHAAVAVRVAHNASTEHRSETSLAELAIVFPALVTTLPAAAVEVFIVHRSPCGEQGITAVAAAGMQRLEASQ